MAAIFNTMLLILSLLLISQAIEAGAPHYASPPNPNIDCKTACKTRCRLSGRQHLCLRACGSCCQTCNCVPPGTFGNQNACPCYAALTTHNKRKKCP